MSIRRPETPNWKQPNPILSDPAQKWWLNQDTGGAVGLGIVATLHKSIILNSPAKLDVNTAPVAITSPRPAGCRKESYWHGQTCKGEGLFCCSSAGSSNKEVIVLEADFLSHCSLCRKQLHGKDVYMYQEKAFCSMECRYQQIVSDEVQEKCRRRAAFLH